MTYKNVKIEMDNHFTKIGQMCVRVESKTQVCWFDRFTNAIRYIRQVCGD